MEAVDWTVKSDAGDLMGFGLVFFFLFFSFSILCLVICEGKVVCTVSDREG